MLCYRCGQHSAESDSLPVGMNDYPVDTGHRGVGPPASDDYRAEAHGFTAIFDLPTSGVVVQLTG